MAFKAQLTASFRQASGRTSATLSVAMPLARNASASLATAGRSSSTTRPGKARTRPGPSSVAPRSVTPATTRSAPAAASSRARRPSPFCSVTTMPRGPATRAATGATAAV
jgi:hypothetical protein